MSRLLEAIVVLFVILSLLVSQTSAGSSRSPSPVGRSRSHSPARSKSPFERMASSTCSAHRLCPEVKDPATNCPIPSTCINGNCAVSLTPCSVGALNHIYDTKINIDWDEVDRHNTNYILRAVNGEDGTMQTDPAHSGTGTSIPVPESWEEECSRLMSRGLSCPLPPNVEEISKKQQDVTISSIDEQDATSLDEDKTNSDLAEINTMATKKHVTCQSCSKVIYCKNNAECLHYNRRVWCNRQPLPQDPRVWIGVCQVMWFDMINHRTRVDTCPNC